MKISSKIALVLLTVFTAKLSAQAQEQLRPYSVGMRVAHLYDLPSYRFDSDLSTDLRGLNGSNTSFDMGLDLYGEVMLTPLIGFQGGFRFAGMTGSNSVEYYDNSFQEFNLDMILVLNNLGKNHHGYLPLNYYAKFGLGRGAYKSERFLMSDNSLNARSRNGFWDGRVGAGLQYEYNSYLRVDFEMTYNVAFDDAFDGYSYGTGRDAYLTTGIGVAYTFGNRDEKPMYGVTLFDPLYLGGMPADEAQKTVKANDSLRQELESLSQLLGSLNGEVKTLDKRLSEQQKTLEQQQEVMEAQQRRMKEQGRIIGDLKDVHKDDRAGAADPTTFWQRELRQVQVYFEFDSDQLTYETKSILRKALSIDPRKVSLIGFASREGNPRYNEQLKQRRVAMVKSFLVEELKLSPSIIVEAKAGDDDELSNESHLNRKVMVKYEELTEVNGQ